MHACKVSGEGRALKGSARAPVGRSLVNSWQQGVLSPCQAQSDNAQRVPKTPRAPTDVQAAERGAGVGCGIDMASNATVLAQNHVDLH